MNMVDQDSDAIKQLQKRLDKLEKDNRKLKILYKRVKKENIELKEELNQYKKIVNVLAGPNTPPSQIPPFVDKDKLKYGNHNNKTETDQPKDDNDSKNDDPTSDQDENTTNKWKTKGRREGHEGVTHNITPDREKDDYIEKCNNCSILIPIGNQQHIYSYDIIDLPKKINLETVRHNVHEAVCNNCGSYNISDKKNSEQGLVGSMIGRKLSALISLIWYRGRVPQDGIGSIIEALTDVGFCPAAIGNCLHAVASYMDEPVEKIYRTLLERDQVNIDETGYLSAIESREVDWIWSFSNSDMVYYEFKPSRSMDDLKEIWDIDPGGTVAIVDGWLAYNYFERIQRCWAHLLRESQDLANRRSGLAVTIDTRLRRLFQTMKQFLKNHPEERDPIFWHDSLIELEEIISFGQASTNEDILKFVKKLTNAKDDLLTALQIPGLPLHNNLAERCLRPLVIHRKIRGFVASDQGKKTLANHATMFETWGLQEKNPYEELLEILPGAC